MTQTATILRSNLRGGRIQLIESLPMGSLFNHAWKTDERGNLSLSLEPDNKSFAVPLSGSIGALWSSYTQGFREVRRNSLEYASIPAPVRNFSREIVQEIERRERVPVFYIRADNRGASMKPLIYCSTGEPVLGVTLSGPMVMPGGKVFQGLMVEVWLHKDQYLLVRTDDGLELHGTTISDYAEPSNGELAARIRNFELACIRDLKGQHYKLNA